MTWTEILTTTAWKGTAILALALAAAFCFRRASSALRHFLWSAAFLTLLILPAALLLTPKWAPPVSFSERIVAVSQGQTGRLPAPVPARRLLLPLIWAAGCLAAAARFAIGAARTSRWIRHSRECTAAGPVVLQLARSLGIGRTVRVLESGAVPVPLTWGMIRPVILLPAGSGAWPEGRLSTVLLHELIHVRRFDLLAQAIAQAACSIFWFHPLAWLGLREQRREREQACDDAVLRLGVPAHDYAGHIMDLVRSVAGRRWGNAVAMADMSDLEVRVRALLDRGRNRRPLDRRSAVAVVAAACAILLPVAALTLQAQAARGTIAGIVSDPSGARVPQCVVTAKNLDGTNQETTTANAAGEYRFAAIPAGRYDVQFQSPGFAAAKVDAALVSGAVLRVDGNLALGMVQESVKIQGKRSAAVPAPAGTPQRIRVGGNVTPVRLLRQASPEYPSELQQLGVEGTVVVRAVISKDGAVLNPIVVNTVDSRLAKSALDSVRNWQYEPGRLNGEPVETLTTIKVDFQLQQ